VIFFIALLIGYPWHILSACTVLYLLSLPAGWKSYRNHERAAAAQASTAVDVANPAPPFAQAPEIEQDDRPVRLN
jgi:CDP-diacylglycerol--serine O-phosphatidyltransferase